MKATITVKENNRDMAVRLEQHEIESAHKFFFVSVFGSGSARDYYLSKHMFFKGQHLLPDPLDSHCRHRS